jgi:malonyl-CoA O-methyltransferase
MKTFISLMAVYHHLGNKERCLEDIKQISPAGLMIEFATQDRYYPERKNWESESQYIQNKLNHRYSILICRSMDYGRPIMLFTNDKFLYLAAGYLRLNRLFKTNLRTLRSRLSPLKTNILLKSRTTTRNKGTSYLKAVEWFKNSRVKGEGIPISDEQHISYPEVTGYTIPTLYQWGEKEMARDLTYWLVHRQNEDGSFSAPDGTPYTFDTGQVVRGIAAALDDLCEVEKPLRRACDWIISQVRIDGRLDTPSTRMWGNIADDRIHLSVLPPLIEAGAKLSEPKYIDAAYRVLEYYKEKKDLAEFNTLSHFYAYIIEALCDLGETDLAKCGMGQVVKLQRKDGSVPAYQNVSWVCSAGLAQFAVIWYKLGMRASADNALEYLSNIQNRTGGFYGSYAKGANYFPREEISWAVKFFLDAYYWKIKTAFNEETKVNIFPNTIDKSDGRVQEILSFFGDLSEKKVIDIGCGKGRFLRVLGAEFASAKLYGLDISEKMLGFCPEGAKTACGSILDIRYPDSYFDCVYCVETLEHALRTEIAIKEMVRILKPGGKIIIIDKNIAKLGELKLEPWEQWFGAEQIAQLLGQYGVEAHYKPIAYGKNSVLDGLFIAWEGIRKHD